MSKQKTALVLGGCGFIGHHLARRLKNEGYYVRVVDIKSYDYGVCDFASDVAIRDLRDPKVFGAIMLGPMQRSMDDKENSFDEVYQLAADMGGAGFVFSRDNDADILHNSGLINFNVAHYASLFSAKKLFFASSACMYPMELQTTASGSYLKEDMAYPANPDSAYGFEKLMAEILYTSFNNNKALDIRIGRFHNIMGVEGTYDGGREKVPAAICRKVAKAKDGDAIEVWGDGEQVRSFLDVDECVEGVLRLMASDYTMPVNIGSEEAVSINTLVGMVATAAGKYITINHVNGPQGVRGRSSDNTLIKSVLNWSPEKPLHEGIEKLYHWINKQVNE